MYSVWLLTHLPEITWTLNKCNIHDKYEPPNLNIKLKQPSGEKWPLIHQFLAELKHVLFEVYLLAVNNFQ